MEDNPLTFVPITGLLPDALDIAVRYERTASDALYLALARALGCPMITADERLDNRLQRTESAPFVRTLGGA